MTTRIPLTGTSDVICLHGSAGSSRQWHRLVARLGCRLRVHTPDLVGYGSQRFDRRARLRLDDEVDAVLSQLPADTGAFHVVGHAYGGAVALRLACRYPDRVRLATRSG